MFSEFNMQINNMETHSRKRIEEVQLAPWLCPSPEEEEIIIGSLREQ